MIQTIILPSKYQSMSLSAITETPAPFDDKNLMTDCLEEWFFEGRVACHDNKIVGFIIESPVVCTYTINMAVYKSMTYFSQYDYNFMVQSLESSVDSSTEPIAFILTLSSKDTIILHAYFLPDNP